MLKWKGNRRVVVIQLVQLQCFVRVVMNVWIACVWRTVLHPQVVQTSRPEFARCSYVN